MALSNLYASVTASLIAEMEKGKIPWAPGFDQKQAAALTGMPRNGKTGRNYNGINVLILWGAALSKGYPSHEWLTFHQANEMGAHVRKGERSTTAVYANKYEVEVEKNGQMEKESRPILRAYPLFNLAQLDNVPPSQQPAELKPLQTRYVAMQEFADRTGIHTVYGGTKACYTPSVDQVHMPPYGSFKNDEEFYGTLAHEYVHASGAKHRIGRDLSGRFGSKQYAAEELIAELGSAFLCAEHGIEPTTRSSAAYLQSWLEVMKEDNRAIFTAASKASEASNWLLEKAREQEQAKQPEPELSY